MSAQPSDLGYSPNRSNGVGLGPPPGLGGTPEGTAAPADASVGMLLKELARELPALLRGEADLAKAEARLGLQGLQQAAAAIAIAGAVAAGGLIMLLFAAAFGIAAAADIELWLSSLIVGIVALAIGMLMLQAARHRMAAQSLMPRQAIDSLRQDKEALRGRTA